MSSSILKPGDHIPLFKLRPSQEIPVKERPPNPFIAAKRKPLILSAKDVALIKERLDGKAADTSKDLEAQEKLKLKESSKNRVQHWNNTVSGQRRQRLVERKHRLEEEEAERVKIDIAHAADEKSRRDEFIQRAKNLMFYEQDKVKRIHSHVILDLVLQERDLQIKYKKEREAQRKALESHSVNRESMWDKRSLQMEHEIHERRQINQQFAEAQHAQHAKKLAHEKSEKDQKLTEGAAIRQLDFEHNSKQHERHAKRLEDQKKLLQDLNAMKDQKQQLKLVRESALVVEEEKIKNWVDAKDRLELLRKNIEQKLFTEHLKVREKIGLEQYAKLSEERNKKNAWVDMRMKQKQKEDQQKEAALQQKKQNAAQEMQKFFKEMQLAKVDEMKRTQELNQKVAEANLRTSECIESERRQAKEKARRKELEIQESHHAQIAKIRAGKEKSKLQVLEDKAHYEKEDAEEKQVLRRYIHDLLEQPWMKATTKIHDVEYFLKKAYEH